MPRLENLDCKYGAPMGRTNHPNEYSGYEAVTSMDHKFHLQKVKLDSGGYDSGGAYWGLRMRGEALYWAVNEYETIHRFIDAKDRAHAKRLIRAEFARARIYR